MQYDGRKVPSKSDALVARNDLKARCDELERVHGVSRDRLSKMLGSPEQFGVDLSEKLDAIRSERDTLTHDAGILDLASGGLKRSRESVLNSMAPKMARHRMPDERPSPAEALQKQPKVKIPRTSTPER